MNQFKQTQKLLEQMQELQNKLEQSEVTGTSGAGLVKVTINCKNDAKMIKIDPSLIVPSDVEILEDLIVAAFNDARKKADEKIAEESGRLTSGFPKIPGLGF